MLANSQRNMLCRHILMSLPVILLSENRYRIRFYRTDKHVSHQIALNYLATCLYHINMQNVGLLWHFQGLCFVACPQASLPQCSNANCYQIYCPKRCTCLGRALGGKK